MKHLLIANKGEVEQQALTLLGASTKRGDDTKIGMFGSGNKYALAYLTRNKIPFSIYSGTTKVEVGTVPASLRGKEFEIFTINGERTSITTEFGKDWKLWEALREFYSNALDEGITEFKVVEEIEPVPGETRIYVEETPQVSDFLLDFDRYFCRYRKPIFECPDGAIYQKLGKEVNIYRKGIRCFETHKESCFDYDLYNVRLDENRRVWGTWEMWEQMWKVILQCPNSSIIRRFLNNLAAGEFVEHEISSSIVSISRDWFVQEAVWEEAIGDNYVVSSGMWNFLSPEEQAKTFLVPRGLWIYLTEFFKDRYTPPGIRTNDGNVTYKVIPANEVDSLHRVMLDQVLDFFKQCNFKVPYPIKIARIDEKHILGTIEKEEQAIILGTLALETGKDEVAKTIIEETIHLHYKVADCTRAFQNASIMLLLNYMKQQNVIIL